MTDTTLSSHDRKLIGWMVGLAGGTLGILGSLQTWVFLPQVEIRIERQGSQTRDLIAAAIEKHASQPHPGSISRTEVNYILDRLKETVTKNDFDSLSIKIERLTDRVIALEKKTER